MIEMTLATKFIPGTNLSGNLACADWRYLLPSLELDKILCIGAPTARVLGVLSTVGKTIHIAAKEENRLKTIKHECEERGLKNIQIHPVKTYSDLPFSANSIDLLFLTKKSNNEVYLSEKEILKELKKLLKAKGVIYFETSSLKARSSAQSSIKALARDGISVKGSYWLTPFTGHLRTAVPAGNKTISAYFFKNVMFGQSFKKRTLSRVGGMLSKTGLISPVVPRHAVMLHKTNGNGTASDNQFVDVPEYISKMAEKAGLDLSKYTFGLNARGKYNANKVIFFLFGKKSRQIEIVLKVTRAPEFNYRLENEFHVLSKLSEGGFVGKETYPGPLFFDYHNKLAVLAIEAVHGNPFRTRTQATANCPVAHSAIQWLLKLGKTSANPDAVTPKDVAKALKQLFETFTDIYKSPKEEVEFLRRQIDTIGNSKIAFPAVFQHGDPGTWNMMVDKGDNIIVIDWEAGEPQGMPLWDIFYFFRTYASWVARQQGSRDALKNFSTHFLGKTDINELIGNTISTYCENTGLARELIKPLFFTCWMHRSLKEACRLTESELKNGHFVNVLRLCMREQNSEALKSLF